MRKYNPCLECGELHNVAKETYISIDNVSPPVEELIIDTSRCEKCLKKQRQDLKKKLNLFLKNYKR